MTAKAVDQRRQDLSKECLELDKKRNDFITAKQKGDAKNRARAVLAADDVGRDLGVGVHVAQRTQDFHLVLAHGVRHQAGRRFHRGQRHELNQMILDHVAQRA